jgi:hypothetical protein
LQLDELPEVLTVEEAAAFLRVSRRLGYQLAREYMATNGAAGLPVMRLGRRLVVPKRRLLRWLEGQPTLSPSSVEAHASRSTDSPTGVRRRQLRSPHTASPATD